MRPIPSSGAFSLEEWKYEWLPLRKTPVFAATAILTLVIGIGANTAIVAVALTAAYLPARRAAQVDPGESLRAE